MSKTKIIAVGAICAFAATTTSATAASFLTSKQIADGTITNRDIHRSTITESRLDPALRAKLNQMAQPGQNGVNGAAGAKGDAGAAGNHGVDGATGAKGGTGAAGKDGVAGKDFDALPEDFSFTNFGQDAAGRSIPVTMTAGGVKFGPYPVANDHSGSVVYNGFTGKLKDIAKLSYTAKYSTDDDSPSAPYLRVYLDNGKDVIFSPVTQKDAQLGQGEWHTYDVTAGTVRYNDNYGDPESEMPWDTIATSAIGDHKVTAIKVTAGYAGGTNLRAMLSDVTVNDKPFHFGS